MKQIEHYKNLLINDIPGEKWVDVALFGRKVFCSNMGRIKTAENIIKRVGAPKL